MLFRVSETLTAQLFVTSQQSTGQYSDSSALHVTRILTVQVVGVVVVAVHVVQILVA